jgi:glutathione peroxidase
MKFLAFVFMMLCSMREVQAGETKIYSFSPKTIDGKERPLADFQGKALLIVNTASRCGYTPQYNGLEELYKKYKDRGFEILGFPANNFLFQEPGSDEEIRKFCSLKYNVTFPMFSKISVKGKNIDPLYQYLTKESGMNGDIPWNFTKFLVNPEGKVVARFDPKTDPLSKDVISAIEEALPKK